jgi:hypothetical protein
MSDQSRLPGLPVEAASLTLSQQQELLDLGLCVYTPEGFDLFLRTPFSEFSGLTALQMIEQGHVEAVLAALASDYEGVVS